MADLTLDQALPAIQDLAQRKANAFVRRFGFASDEREDVESQLVLTFLVRWPKFDSGRASVRTFASRVMDKALTSILRRHLAPSRRNRRSPEPMPAQAQRFVVTSGSTSNDPWHLCRPPSKRPRALSFGTPPLKPRMWRAVRGRSSIFEAADSRGVDRLRHRPGLLRPGGSR